MKVFKVDTIENSGENWLIADFGTDQDDNKHYILTTDHVPASHLYMMGTAREHAELACKLLNGWWEEDERIVDFLKGEVQSGDEDGVSDGAGRADS